jgi:hypothetical protein
MKKPLAGILLLVVCMLWRPSGASAQMCSMFLSNNTTKIGLAVLDYVYNTFTQNTYYVTYIYADPSGNICIGVWDQPVSVTKTTDMSTVFPGSGSAKGLVFEIPAGTICNSANGTFPDNNGLRQGSFSLSIRNVLGADPFFVVDYTDGQDDQCFYTPLPVTFGPFTANIISASAIKLNWTTYTESMVDHFSIEKSLNGADWYKIGQVPAAGDSYTPLNYEFIDDHARRNTSYYRIVSVDLDCRKQYSDVVVVNCAFCSPFIITPVVPPDCVGPNTNPYIDGPATICDNSSKLFRIKNIDGFIRTSWSFSAPSLATIKYVGRMAVLTPTGVPGLGTLYATVVRGNVTTTYEMQVEFGTAGAVLSGWCSSSGFEPCGNSYEFTATVNMFPGTSGVSYHWYLNGSYIGTGQEQTWSVYPGPETHFEVYYYDYCGTATWSGSTQDCNIFKGTATPKESSRYKLLQNPTRNTIAIMLTKRCPIDQLKSRAMPNGHSVIIKLFDAQGVLRKTTRVSTANNKLSVNAGDLPAGLYFVHILEERKETATLKVLLEK